MANEFSSTTLLDKQGGSNLSEKSGSSFMRIDNRYSPILSYPHNKWTIELK